MTQNRILMLAVLAVAGCAAETDPPPTAEAPAEQTAAAPAEGARADEAQPDEAGGIAGVAPAREARAEGARIDAADFDLGKVSAALKAHEVKDGEALEVYINDPDNGITRVDVDGDGEVDVIRIDETREAQATAFEIKAVPSSAKHADDAVTIAVVRIRPERKTRRIVVVSRYTDVVVVHDRHEWRYVETVEYDDDGLIVLGPGQVFFGWLFAVQRPVFHSVVIDLGHRHRVHHDVIEVVDHCWPPGHCKHRHERHEHHGKYSKRKKKYYKGKYAKRGRGKYGKHKGKHKHH